MHQSKLGDQPRRPQEKYTPPQPMGVKDELIHNGNNRYRINTCPKCGGKKSKVSELCWSCWNASKRPPIDEVVYMFDGTRCRKIPLTKDKYALVYAEHYDWLMQWNWTAWAGDKIGKNFYAAAGFNSGEKIVMMHNVIGEKYGMTKCDHKNLVTLDNRAINLRQCDFGQNAINRALSRNNKSGFNGVYWNKEYKGWVAHIRVKRRGIRLGIFDDKRDAARVRDAAAIHYFGEFATINLINDVGSDLPQQGRQKYGKRPASRVYPVFETSVRQFCKTHPTWKEMFGTRPQVP